MMSYGLSLAGFTSGFQRGHDWKERNRRAKKNEERQDKLNETYDPIDLETAMLRLKDARRSGELNEYLQKYRKGAADRQNEQGIRDAKRDKASLPGDILSSGYRATREKNADRIEHDSMPGRIKQVGFDDTAAKNANELGTTQHPINMKGAEFSGRVQTDQIEQYDQEDQFWGDYENVQNALGSFAMTGDPKILMDAYEMYIDDGIDAVITKDDDGGYTVSVNNGQPDARFESKEELLQATEQIFNRHMQRKQPRRGYGIGTGMGMGGSMMGGMGGQGAKPTAQMKNAQYLIEAMSQLPKYAGLPPAKLRLLAFNMQDAKADDSPTGAIRNFFNERFSELMNPRFGNPPDPVDAFNAAQAATEQYTAKYFPEYTTNKAIGEGEDGNKELEGFVQDMVGHQRTR